MTIPCFRTAATRRARKYGLAGIACLLFLLAQPTLSATLEEDVGVPPLSASDTKLLEWLHKNSFHPEGLELAYFPPLNPGDAGYHRGLKATKDFKRGDLMLKIPKRFFMSYLSGIQSKIGKVLGLLKDAVGEKVVLALHFLYERVHNGGDDGADSWGPYVNIAPDQTDLGHLLFWSEADLGLLQCPEEWQCPVLERVRKQRKKVNTLYTQLRPVMTEFFPKGEFTYDNFAWAYATTLSRAFSLNITERYGHTLVGEKKEDGKGHGLISLMVPFCDFLNHHNSRPALQFAYDYNDTAKELRAYADQDYKKGEEVFISYGIMTNPDLMMTYGFAMPNNAYETVGFALGMDQMSPTQIAADPLLPKKLALLTRQKLDPGMQTHVALDGQPSPRFLEGMRIRELSVKHVLPSESCGPPDITLPTDNGSPGRPPFPFPSQPPPQSFHPEHPMPGPPMPGFPASPGPGGTAPGASGGMNTVIQKAIQEALSQSMPGLMGGDNDQVAALKGMLGSDGDGSELIKNVLKGLNVPGLNDAAGGQVAAPTAASTEKKEPTLEEKTKGQQSHQEQDKKLEDALTKLNPDNSFHGDNEVAVFTALAHGAEVLLAKYPTSLEQDLSYFDPRSPHKLTLFQRQALIMRIELKRILHAFILECMQGLRSGFKMQATERDYGLPDEVEAKKGSTAALDEGLHPMEKKRIDIQKQMISHFHKGTKEWDEQWEQWREDIRLAWGEQTAPPKNSVLLSQLGSSEDILEQARKKFESGGDGDEGIRIGDFLRFSEMIAGEIEELKEDLDTIDLDAIPPPPPVVPK